MKDRRDEGLWGWKQKENNNKIIAMQRRSSAPHVGDLEAVELAYFGGSAFRIMSRAGLTILIDPWRNLPSGNNDWFVQDFPSMEVDIGISTHSHFDHDALHILRASMLLDRPVGVFTFADVKITGIADKHVFDSTHSDDDWAETIRSSTDMKTTPPNNWRSFDNCLVLIETAGLRILHWGDNRPDPPAEVWDMLGEIDIALLPIDGSQHILSYKQAELIARRLKAKIIVPHHYYIKDINTISSTLRPPDQWVDTQSHSTRLDKGLIRLAKEDVKDLQRSVFFFGEHVAFTTPNSQSGSRLL